MSIELKSGDMYELTGILMGTEYKSMLLRDTKKDYLRKVIAASLNGRKYSTVVFQASFCLDNIKDIVEELKDEFQIENLIFIDFDNDKVKEFFDSNPSEEEIEKFVPKFTKNLGKVKAIYFNNDATDFSKNYRGSYSIKYYKALIKCNKELFAILGNQPECNQTVSVLPNEAWAKNMLGSADQVDKLWFKVNDLALDLNQAQKEAYLNGRSNLFDYFVGQVMKETRGKANPSLTKDILKDKLK